MKKEIWKSVKGYEGYYEVSSYGRVRSLDRMVTRSDGKKRLFKGKILKMCFCGSGYLYVTLSKNGETNNKYPHRLVAETFLPNPNNLSEVNHKDENKTNNCAENLEWCSHLYNANYGTRNKRVAEKLSMPVHQIDNVTDEVIAVYPSVREAGRQTVFDFTAISACCRGKCKTAYGFKWRYQD